MTEADDLGPRPGGHPGQHVLHDSRAIFTTAYAVIPLSVQRDIVISRLPHWSKARAWILARPMTGFAETFSQILLEVEAGGGSDRPEEDQTAQSALFVLSGRLLLTIDGEAWLMEPGGFAWIPPGATWSLWQRGGETARLQWIRKAYEPVAGIDVPPPIITSDHAITPAPMPSSGGVWATTQFMDPDDLGHDMHITIVTLQPGGCISFPETHVMEHGLYIIEGKGVYRLNDNWVEVAAGDFLWLRAFCPQACYAGGPGPFRYLLYKDVNRLPKLKPG
ncbi:MAG: bifunctional allantoicase/(S)-ureidoglycine aminohydrolase [Pseudomonadota bacterium]